MFQIVGYARVSSREQSENSHALEQQIDRLKTAGAEHIYCDVESGANPERPEFKLLLEQVRDRKVTTVIATRWDRLTRNQDTYAQIKLLLQESKVKLRLLDQGDVDLSTAFGELSADMQAIFAVHERRMLKERVSRGFEYKRKKKSAWGRQPWGYTVLDDKYVLDKQPLICLLDETNGSENLSGISKSDIAREAIEYFLKIRKPNDVVRYLYKKYGVGRKSDTNLVLSDELLFWSSGANFSDWILNPVLRGHTAYNKYESKYNNKRGSLKPMAEWEFHENTHPDQVLLSEAEFQEVQSILNENSRTMGTRKTRSFLTGLIICDQCLSKCVRKSNIQYQYYGCRNYGMGCNNKTNVRVDRIEAKLFVAILKRIQEYQKQDNSWQSAQKIQSTVHLEIQSLAQQLEEIKQMLANHRSNALEKAKIDLEALIKAKQNGIDLDSFKFELAQDLIEYPYLSHLGFWYSLNIQEREILYSKLLKAIYVLHGEITKIEFTF